MAVELNNWIPKFIKQVKNILPGTTVTADEYNGSLNLLIEQGDYNAETLEALLERLKTDYIQAGSNIQLTYNDDGTVTITAAADISVDNAEKLAGKPASDYATQENLNTLKENIATNNIPVSANKILQKEITGVFTENNQGLVYNAETEQLEIKPVSTTLGNIVESVVLPDETFIKLPYAGEILKKSDYPDFWDKFKYTAENGTLDDAYVISSPTKYLIHTFENTFYPNDNLCLIKTGPTHFIVYSKNMYLDSSAYASTETAYENVYFYSSDNGKTWQRRSVIDFAGPNKSKVYLKYPIDIVSDGLENSPVFLISFSNYNVYKSTDHGYTFVYTGHKCNSGFFNAVYYKHALYDIIKNTSTTPYTYTVRRFALDENATGELEEYTLNTSEDIRNVEYTLYATKDKLYVITNYPPISYPTYNAYNMVSTDGITFTNLSEEHAFYDLSCANVRLILDDTHILQLYSSKYTSLCTMPNNRLIKAYPNTYYQPLYSSRCHVGGYIPEDILYTLCVYFNTDYVIHFITPHIQNYTIQQTSYETALSDIDYKYPFSPSDSGKEVVLDFENNKMYTVVLDTSPKRSVYFVEQDLNTEDYMCLPHNFLIDYSHNVILNALQANKYIKVKE